MGARGGRDNLKCWTQGRGEAQRTIWGGPLKGDLQGAGGVLRQHTGPPAVRGIGEAIDEGYGWRFHMDRMQYECTTA